MTATDSGFTTGVRTIILDSLSSGEALTFRRAASLGDTLYGKARWIDELGQRGSWSAAVSAAAAGASSVSYFLPVTTARLTDEVHFPARA